MVFISLLECIRNLLIHIVVIPLDASNSNIRQLLIQINITVQIKQYLG